MGKFTDQLLQKKRAKKIRTKSSGLDQDKVVLSSGSNRDARKKRADCARDWSTEGKGQRMKMERTRKVEKETQTRQKLANGKKIKGGVGQFHAAQKGV